MDGWDLALLVAAGYVAVTALVRLMLRRRQELVEQFGDEVRRERRRRRARQDQDAERKAA